jgi:Trk-type K+ transport system membrane component
VHASVANFNSVFSTNASYSYADGSPLQLISDVSQLIAVAGANVTFACVATGEGYKYFYNQIIWHKVRNQTKTFFLLNNCIFFILLVQVAWEILTDDPARGTIPYIASREIMFLISSCMYKVNEYIV